VHFRFHDGDKAQRLDLPAVLAEADHDTHLYVCGPGGFIDFATSTAKARGRSQAEDAGLPIPAQKIPKRKT